MELLKKLEDYKYKIDKIRDSLKALEQERIDWSRDNRKDIKSLYPKVGKIYQLTELPNSWAFRDLEDDVYYFKPTNTRFDPANMFNWWTTYPTVKGDVLDSNLKVIGYGGDDVCITKVVEIKPQNNPKNFSNKITKVYVMIDKNTGFYKIGRSKTRGFR